MMRCMRLYRTPLGAPALWFGLFALIASIINVTGKLELLVIAVLSILGLSLAGILERAGTRPPLEYLHQLPLPRRESLWSPYASASVWMVIVSALVHLHESSGLAAIEVRNLARIVGADASGIEHFERPAALSLRHFAYPQLAFWGATYLIHAGRHYLPAHGRSMWISYAIAYVMTFGLLVLAATTWMTKSSEELFRPTYGLLGLEALPMFALCFYCAHVVRKRLVENDLERIEIKEQSWDY